MDKTTLYIKRIEAAIAESLPVLSCETHKLSEMLMYSLESGGKRVRPLLCLEFCDCAGGDIEKAINFAIAVEYIHTYSLIHDDLPCMDNDDYRRGKLTSHKMFGEANALLAGDALLTHAFSLVADASAKGFVTDTQAIKAVRELSRLAGMNGMIGGQYIDLKYENTPATLEVLLEMDTLKTAALIESACVLGLIAADADDSQILKAREFAVELGVAFQIMDDVLEAEDDSESSDIKNGKVTYVSLFGIEKAKDLAAEHTEKALAALEYFGERASDLKNLAHSLLFRKN